MNRLLSIILALVLLVSFVPLTALSAPAVWDGSIGVGFAGGTGTEADPYLIKTGSQLAYFAKAVTLGTGYSEAYIKLANDILLNDTTNWKNWSETVAPANSWTPIAFAGTFDGCGHTVSGIYINTTADDTTADDQGLFGFTLGIVKNLGVINSYIKGRFNVGGLVGLCNGEITNCYNTGTIKGSNSGTGGVAGEVYYYGMVTNCHNSGIVTGNSDVGGVAGEIHDHGAIINNYNTGVISGNSCIGGVAGRVSGNDNFSGTVMNCYNTGTVSGNSCIGGVAGKVYYNSTVTNCYNTGTVTGAGNYVGGVAGDVYYYKSTVTKCYNTGAVKGSGDNVGGVAGYNEGTVENCYNAFTVTGANSVGGVAGYIKGTVKNSYNTGKITGTSAVGGVAGTAWGTLTGCYYLHNQAAGGIGGTDIPGQAAALSDAQMKQKSSFTGWDFNSVWFFDSSGGYKYPTLAAGWLKSIGIKTNITKTYYVVGDTLNTAGLTLTAIYSNGITRTITSGFTCTPMKLTTAGTQKITVAYGGKTVAFSVMVTPTGVKVNGITLNAKTASIIIGATKQLTATVTPSNATNKAVTWISSNTSVATVSTSGVVTAKAYGKANITCKTKDGGKTATCVVTVIPKTPTKVKAASASYNSIKITWTAVSGATGYAVYRATSKTGTYTNLGSATSASITDKKANTGTTYYYKVRAYKIVGSTKYYSGYSAILSAKAVPAVPASFTAAKASTTSVKTTWKAVTGATGYEVWMATSSDGTYSKIATTTKTTYTKTKLTKNKTYYFKVRAYKTVGNTKVYGAFTSVKSAKPS